MPAVSPGPATSELSDADKLFGLSAFWREVSYNFAFFDQVPDLDWDEAYRDFIPEVLATESTYEYYRVLERFCALLGDGHTNIYYPADLWSEMRLPPIRIQELNKEAYVTNVDTSMQDQIPLGSQIVAVDGKDFEEFMEEDVLPYISTSAEHMYWDQGVRNALRGISGTTVDVTILTPDVEERTVTLTRSKEDVTWATPSTPRGNSEFRWLRDGLAYVALNTFNDPTVVTEFRSYLPALEEAKGVVIDISRNGGGNTGNGTAVLGHFTNRTLKGNKWRTRKHVAAFKAWGVHMERYSDYVKGEVWHEGGTSTYTPPEGPKLDVPVVVIIGRRTASAAEDFLVHAETLEQFTTVGEATFGSTGQPLFFDLPGGGRARVCTKRDTYPDGRDFVGYGIVPDIPVERTLAMLLGEEQPALDKAIAILEERIGARSP